MQDECNLQKCASCRTHSSKQPLSEAVFSGFFFGVGFLLFVVAFLIKKSSLWKYKNIVVITTKCCYVLISLGKVKTKAKTHTHTQKVQNNRYRSCLHKVNNLPAYSLKHSNLERKGNFEVGRTRELWKYKWVLHSFVFIPDVHMDLPFNVPAAQRNHQLESPIPSGTQDSTVTTRIDGISRRYPDLEFGYVSVYCKKRPHS